ncbi:MAG: tyrosine-type recombinase/integrase [Oribacterium sp.]|nr:tyrosine-type recombinase/integrase [Oribacterium sp.]
MSHEYRNQLDIKNNEKINKLLNEMPEFIEYFYDHMVANGRSTNTILGYMYEINVFLRFVQVIVKKDSVKHLEVSDLEKLRQNNIDKYISNYENGIKLSNNAKCRKLSVLKTLYTYYLGSEMITKNPTVLMESPKIKAHDVIKLTDSQVSALLNAIRNQNKMSEHAVRYNERMVSRDLAIIMTLLGTGMRISELVGLNISDIDKTDETKRYLRIVRKGGDEDKVRVIDPVFNAITDYMTESRPQLVGSSKENALFISTRGTRMSVNAIQKMLEKYCEKAGLPDNISPHKMRATFATKVYAETKDIYAIKDALHHSTIDTSKHYISDKEARIDAAAEAAGKLFG